jgi:hypothetical protein
MGILTWDHAETLDKSAQRLTEEESRVLAPVPADEED